MREVRCIVSAENSGKITALLAEIGIECCIEGSDTAEIILVEKGLQHLQDLAASENGLTVIFDPERTDLLKQLLTLSTERMTREPGFIIGSRHNNQQLIQNEDILFFRADGNYVYAVTADDEFEVKHRLYELEQRFRCGRFVRTGKSFIVNIMKVTEIIPWFGSRLLLRIDGTGQRLEVSRTYVKSFREFLEL